MKIYYSTDGSVDDNLEQVCPFGELHHFKREDGSEYTIPKRIGCGGCVTCKHCYGAGINYYQGGIRAKDMILVPRNIDASEDERVEMKFAQFFPISKGDYVKCSLCFTEKYRNRTALKLKIWWWHHIGYHFKILKCKFTEKINKIF